MKQTFLKKQDTLAARHQEAEDLWKSIPENGWFQIEYIKKRNYKNHSRWMTFCRVTFDIQDHFEEYEVWRKHLQMLAGHYETCVLPSGDVQYWPSSIAFDQMEEDEFNKMVSAGIQRFITRYAQKMTEEQILNAIGFD